MNVLSAITYYLVIKPVSWLPFAVLRGISWVFYFFIFRIARYRTHVVMDNIRRSFPDRTEAEHREICRKFYLHFTDLILESFKTFSIGPVALRRHLTCANPELLQAFYDRGQDVIITVGHFNSWEFFLTGIDGLIPHQGVVIYQPLTNKYFDRKIAESRSRHGTQMIATREVRDFFRSSRTKPAAVVFAIDQSPSDSARCYWMEFLNQETGVLFGAEKFAVGHSLPVVFARIHKVKRGYYQLEFELVCENAATTAYGDVTERSTRLLENDIRKRPEFWLWSHRRWKHKKPAEQVLEKVQA